VKPDPLGNAPALSEPRLLPGVGTSEALEVPRHSAGARLRWAVWLEALGVVLSPAAAALVLRLRLMAPSALPDPASLPTLASSS
jgi:hypothetical protein